MKKGNKTALIAAGCMVLVGAILVAAGMAALRFDISRLRASDYETTSYTIGEGFSGISITGWSSNVRFYPSEDDTCRVVCRENKNISFEVGVLDDTLYIRRPKAPKFYVQFGVQFGETGITVYLPEDSYDSLTLKTSSGDVKLPEDFHFTSARVEAASGEIRIHSSVAAEEAVSSQSGNIYVKDTAPEVLSIQSTSGAITAENVEAREDIQIKSTSGDITLSHVHGNAIEASASSGELALNQVTAKEDLNLKTTSGDITLNGCDGNALDIQSTSGRVSGSLLSQKTFDIHTKSGTVEAPHSASGGICRVTTTSGDVTLRITPDP